MSGGQDIPTVHLKLEDALRSLKKRCKYPQSVVFDLDGTLLLGKTPIAPLCKYYRNLCDRCHVTIVTARSSAIRQDTINQLKKHHLDCFTELLMQDQKHPLPEEEYKIRSLHLLNPDLAIGNRWHDLNINNVSALPDDVYIVGSTWLKVPA